MNTVMFDLQAAVMAASAGGIPIIPDTGISGDGISFSDVLASQTGIAAAEEITVSENVIPENGYVVPEEYIKPAIPNLNDIIGQLQKTDNGMMKGLKMLLDTVIKAIRGSDDGQERKTDLFSVLFDGSASLTGEDEDMFLISSELMNQISGAISFELESDTESDKIIEELETILERMYGVKKKDDEEDDEEETAFDILAALINTPLAEAELEEYVFEDAEDLIDTIEEIFAYPKQSVAENHPEKVQQMEEIYADYRSNENEKEIFVEKHETIKMSFSGVKINNASEQIETITGNSESVSVPVAVSASEPEAELAALNTAPQFIQTVSEVPEFPEEEAFDVTEYEPVEDQITEAISDKLFDITGDNGTEELIMILKPENLGQVAIRLVKENGALSVTLSAQHAEVGRMMAERAAELSTSLESKDIEVKNVEVVNPGNAAAQMGLDFTNQGFSRRQEYSSEGNRNSYRGIQEVSETDEIEETEDIKIREARLWTQA